MSKKTLIPSCCRQKVRNRADQAYVNIGGKGHWLGVFNSERSKAQQI